MKCEQSIMKKYIVSELRKDSGLFWYVCARPGYMRCSDGSTKRDGSFKGGPEWTTNPNHALKFTSKLAAARVKGKCPSAYVQEVSD